MDSPRSNDRSSSASHGSDFAHRRRHPARATSLAPASAPVAPSQSSPGAASQDGSTTFASLRGVGAGSSRLPFALAADHPVSVIRDELRGLYEQLDSFIETNSVRPHPGFGFKAVALPAVEAEPLISRCNQVLTALNKVIYTPALDALMVQSHQMANDLKMQILGFRKFLANPHFSGGVPEDHVESLLQNSIIFQRVISDPMNDATSLALGVSVRRGPAPSSE